MTTLILSSNGSTYYEVDAALGTCTCLAYRFGSRPCKHIKAAQGGGPIPAVSRIQSRLVNADHKDQARGYVDPGSIEFDSGGHQPVNTLYTIGYTGRRPDELLSVLKDLGGPYLVDVRLKPVSRNSAYNLKAFSGRAADQGISYRHLQSLGNLNYRGDGPIILKAPATGLSELTSLLEESPVVIMCMCAKYAGCHREYVVEAMRRRFPALMVHHL